MNGSRTAGRLLTVGLLIRIAILSGLWLPACQGSSHDKQPDPRASLSPMPEETPSVHLTGEDLIGFWIPREEPDKYPVGGYYFTITAFYPNGRASWYTLDGDRSTYMGLNERNINRKIPAVTGPWQDEPMAEGAFYYYELKNDGRQLAERYEYHITGGEGGEINEYNMTVSDVRSFSDGILECAPRTDGANGEKTWRLRKLPVPYNDSILDIQKKAWEMNQDLIIDYCREQLAAGKVFRSLKPFPGRSVYALSYAASADYVRVAAYLLERGADCERTYGDYYKQTSLLNVALAYGSVETALLLLEAGADARQPVFDHSGSGTHTLHPLICAVKSRSVELCRALLERGASVPVAGDDDYASWGKSLEETTPPVRELFRRH